MRFSLCFTLQKGHVAFDGLELCIYLKGGVRQVGIDVVYILYVFDSLFNFKD